MIEEVREIDQQQQLITYVESIQKYLDNAINEYKLPGISVSIVANDHTINVSSGFSHVNVIPMTSESRFELGSLSKYVISLLLLKLADEQKINLQDKIAVYLEELRVCEIGNNVSIEHLLTETGGFRTSSAINVFDHSYSWDNLVSDLGKNELHFRPGTVFSSCQATYALLAEILQRVKNQSVNDQYKSFLYDILSLEVDRLEFRQSKYNVASHSFVAEKGNAICIPNLSIGKFWRHSVPDIWLSTSDIARILQPIMPIRNEGSNLFCNNKYYQLLNSAYLKVPRINGRAIGSNMPTGVGYGCYEYFPSWFGMDRIQNGQFVGFRYHSSKNYAVVIGANSNASQICNRVIKEILKSLGFVNFTSITNKDNPLENIDQYNIEGEYEGLSGGQVLVSKQDDDLLCLVKVPGRNQFSPVLLQQDGVLGWIPKPEFKHFSLGFFTDPSNESVGLMIGMEAYKKI